MSNPTLYLIQSNFSNTPYVFDKVKQIYRSGDAIVLMGEAALYMHDERLNSYADLYVLDTDAEMVVGKPASHIHFLDYAKFADLVLNFQRSISLK